MMVTHTLPIAVVARETGLSADLLRKWEARYGFPKPARSATGIRRYPLDQVEILREITRRMASGIRPAEAIRRCTGDSRAKAVSGADGGVPRGIVEDCLDALRAHDAQHLHMLLDRNLVSLGVQAFIARTAAPLTVAVGDEWLRGNLRVHEEHLFSSTLAALLSDLHRRLHFAAGRRRILMTTPPGEPHTLGLDMVRVLFAEAGAHCIHLGAQTPLAEIAAAAAAYDIGLLALSYSAAYPPRLLNAGLLELRALLPPDLPIWIGGSGCQAASSLPPGIRAFVSAADAVEALRYLA